MGTNWKPRQIRVPFQFQYREKRKQTMDVKTYQELALRTMADQEKILNRISPRGLMRQENHVIQKMQLINGVIGLADEVGELSGAVKKHIEYGQVLDLTNLKEEVGDCFWRLRQICDAVGLTFEECMEANIEKLKKRYPEKYSDHLAAEENRDRAAERDAMTPPAIANQEHNVTHTSKIKRPLEAMPANWDKDPYSQTGAGWSEPELDSEEKFLPPVVRVSTDNGSVKIDPPNQFSLARRIADTYLEGQNKDRAMIEIQRAEQRQAKITEAMIEEYSRICTVGSENKKG